MADPIVMDTDRQTTVEALRAIVSALDQKTDAQWMASLAPRKRAELKFHDWDRSASSAEGDPLSTDRQTANRKYYTTAKASHDHVADWIKTHARGRVFLDYACGNGDYAIVAATAGAALAIGIDISRVAVQNAQRRAAHAGASKNTLFVQADCEATELPSDSVDAVICSGMLHHLDLSYAFYELRRIMRPGGKCLALEALNYNPAIKFYRWLTPHIRTEWEKRHILSLKDVRFAQRFFDVQDVRYWHLFSVLATPLRNTRSFVPALRAANAIDGVVLRIPVVRRLAWMFSFELIKRQG